MNSQILLQANGEGGSGFFDSPWVDFAMTMVQVFIVALWLALVFWTYKDARRRVGDPVMVWIAVAAALLLPFAGALFYAILRPPEYLDDVLERELEIRARELEIAGGAHRCPSCDVPVRDDFLVCPNCRHRLRTACGKCGRPLDSAWRLCPYCETEVQPGSRARIKAEDDLFV